MQFLFTIAASAMLSLVGVGVSAQELSGEATFYSGNVAGGACGFSTYTIPSGIYGTALSSSNWDNSAECGACVSVTGPSGNSITAMVVDECPDCGLNHLDLFSDAFAVLANPTTGVIDVTWEYVDCPITSPIQLVNKDGVSAYWFSMQVINANEAVSTLEVSTDGGSTWTDTTRQTYNFFENESGFGTTTVDVRVTSISGAQVVVDNVDVSSGASAAASSNFDTGSSAAVADAAVGTTASTSTPVAVSTTATVQDDTTPAPTTTTTPTTSDVVLSSVSLAPASTSTPTIQTTTPTTYAIQLGTVTSSSSLSSTTPSQHTTTSIGAILASAAAVNSTASASNYTNHSSAVVAPKNSSSTISNSYSATTSSAALATAAASGAAATAKTGITGIFGIILGAFLGAGAAFAMA